MQHKSWCHLDLHKVLESIFLNQKETKKNNKKVSKLYICCLHK